MIREEMMARMSNHELMEWWVMDQIEPFGDRRSDIQAGMIQQNYTNMNRDRKVHPQPFGLEMFLPKFVSDSEPEVKQQTPEEQMAIWEAIMMAQNASLPPDATN